jgi:hypothetical protein
MRPLIAILITTVVLAVASTGVADAPTARPHPRRRRHQPRPNADPSRRPPRSTRWTTAMQRDSVRTLEPARRSHLRTGLMANGRFSSSRVGGGTQRATDPRLEGIRVASPNDAVCFAALGSYR